MNKIVNNPNQITIIQKPGIVYLIQSLITYKKLYKYNYEIQDMVKSGQVQGVHRAKNHKTWSKNCGLWNYGKICKKLRWAQDKIKQTAPHVDLTNFSIPTWQTSEDVILICENLSFKNVYNSCNSKKIDSCNKKIGIFNTELCKSINGIGYLEFLIAKSYILKNIVNEVINQLEMKEKKVVLYDHSVIADIQGIKILSSVIDWSQYNRGDVNVDE